MAYSRQPESDGLSNPAPSPTVISTRKTDTPESPFILALPAEVLLKIIREPDLWRDDRANLRLVCKDLLPYATKAFSEQRFEEGLRLNPSTSDLLYLATVCSSQLRSALSFVHFTHSCKRRALQHKGTTPDYSAIRVIVFDAHLEAQFSARALKKMLQQTIHLETFVLDLEKVKNNNCWCAFDNLFGEWKPPITATDEERQQMDTVLAGIQSDSLSELVIKSTFVSYKVLKSLLERHRDTIRKLSMLSCQVTGGSWDDLLQWVSHNLPSLEHLELYRLQEMTWRRAFDKYDKSDMRWTSSVTTTGKKEIDTYIACLGKSGTSD